MQVEAISYLAPVSEPSLLPMAQQAAPSGQFAHWFNSQLTAVSDQLSVADRGVQQLAAGENVSLHQVMIDLEHAKVSLQLLMQVRTQLLESFQEVLRSQL